MNIHATSIQNHAPWLVLTCASMFLLSPLDAIAREAAGTSENRISSEWNGGKTGEVTVRNPHANNGLLWEVTFTHDGPLNVWNAEHIESNGNRHTYRQPAWDKGIDANESKSFGYVSNDQGIQNIEVRIVGLPDQNVATNDSTTTTTHNTSSETAPPPAVQPAASASTPASGSVTLGSGDWYKAVSVTVDEPTSKVVLEFDYAGNVTTWNGDLQRDGDHYTLTLEGDFKAGQSIHTGLNLDNQDSLDSISIVGSDTSVDNQAQTSDTSAATEETNQADNTTETDNSVEDNTVETQAETEVDNTQTETIVDTGPAPSHGKRVIGYFTAWGIYGRDYQVADIPADKLTHINYAFININPNSLTCELGDPWADTDKVFPADNGLPAMSWNDGPEVLHGNFGRLQQLKAKYPHLKTMMSIGGWTWSKYFSNAALTDASRQHFVQSCVAMMHRYGFDGIDVDWEYPVAGGLANNIYRPEDKQNYTLLMQEFRRQLNTLKQQTNQTYLLSIAAPAGYDKFVNLELAQLAETLDFINIMTYDYHGAWDSTTNNQAALYSSPNNPASQEQRLKYNTHHTVQAYLLAGVPADKLVVGLPFYGRSWKGVDCNQNGGLYQANAKKGGGTWEDGVYDYAHIADLISSGQRVVYEEMVDGKLSASYVCGNNEMASYDSPEMIRDKVGYAKYHGLGGVMFWELSGDIRDSEHPKALLNVIHQELN